MNCDLCGQRQAVIHIHQIIGKRKRKVHLCERCAAEKGITNVQDKLEIDIVNMFASLFESRSVRNQNQEIKSCSSCGMTTEQFNKQNQFGCNHCYSAFNRLLRYKMKKLSGRMQYTGKVPKKLQCYKVLFMDLEKLKQKLEEAIQNENYEQAAAFRDEINRIRCAGYTYEHRE